MQHKKIETINPVGVSTTPLTSIPDCKWTVYLVSPSGQQLIKSAHRADRPKPAQPAEYSYPSASYGYGYGGGYDGGYGGDSYGYEPRYDDFDFGVPPININFKYQNKEIKCTVRGDDNTVPWCNLFTVEKSLKDNAFVLSLSSAAEADLGHALDSYVPMLFGLIDRVSASWIVEIGSSDIHDLLAHDIAAYLGAIAIVNRSKEDPKKIKEDLKQIVELTTVSVSYSKEMLKKFKLINLVRFGSLEELTAFTENSEWDINTTDPVGNNLLHLAMLNVDTRVFEYLGDLIPDHINKTNIFGNTPIHNLPRISTDPPAYVDWRGLWNRPIDYSIKNKSGLTALEAIKDILPDAFTELLQNETACAAARSSHANWASLLLSPFVALLKEPSQTDIHTAIKLFVAKGVDTNSSDGILLTTVIEAEQFHCLSLLLELGVSVTEKNIILAFRYNYKQAADILLKRPELLNISPEGMKSVCQNAVCLGWTDAIRYLIQQGVSISTEVNNHARSHLDTVNYLVQLDASKELLANAEGARIHDIRVNRQKWQWVLYLDDRQKQKLCLDLYRALPEYRERNQNYNIHYRINNSSRILKIDVLWKQDGYGDNQNLTISIIPSPGEPPKTYTVYYHESSITTCSLHVETSSYGAEEGAEVLSEIMELIGWDPKDKFVFLIILRSMFTKGELLADNNWSTFLNRYMQIPDWYAAFMLRVYNSSCPPIPSPFYT